jgi:hypothetical protein
MKNYLDVTIRIFLETERGQEDGGGPGLRPARYRVLVDSPQGQGESTLELPFTLGEPSRVVFDVAQTARNVTADTGLAGGPSHRDFGEKLYEALFKGEVKSRLDATIGMARERPDTGVRIRLSMNLQGHGMADVASLPWEFMRRPKDPSPLVMSNRTLLVRSLDVPEPTDPQPYQPPLRILALVSNPTGTAPLNLDEERARITKNWALLPGVKVDFARPVRAELLKQLAAADYHVIHYMGHGDFQSETGGSLLLEHEDGSADSITGEELGVFLADELPTLRLVFLNACKTGTTSARSAVDPFAGVATSLIKAGVPAVVAMQFPISDQAAISFADTFYQRIAQRYPVDAAVAEARKALYSERKTEWATAVVFLRSKDGVLFEPSRDAAAVGSCAPLSQARRVGAAGTPATDDPWGPVAADSVGVFLAAPNEKLRPLHRMLSAKLTAAGVRVVGSIPPPYDAKEHAAAVQSLVRRADLCVHLLGESVGEPFDETAALRTYPLEQLRTGLEADRPQLVLIPDEVDIELIANPEYKAFVCTLIERPRDSARFELVRTGRHQLADEIMAKLQRLQESRRAALAPGAPGGPIGSAFVDAHRTDLENAQALESYLIERNIDVTKKTSSNSASDAVLQFDVKLSNFPLYIVVSGRVDKGWVESRLKAAAKSAVDQDAKAMVVVYLAPPVQGPEQVKLAITQLRIRYDFTDDPGAKDALIAQFARGTA